MNLSCRAVLIGTETIISQKTNKEYYRVLIAQGADSYACVTEDKTVLKLPLYKEYDVIFRLNTRYERLMIESLKEVL